MDKRKRAKLKSKGRKTVIQLLRDKGITEYQGKKLGTLSYPRLIKAYNTHSGEAVEYRVNSFIYVFSGFESKAPKRRVVRGEGGRRKKDYSNYLKSDKWRLKREELFIARGGKICERCQSTKSIQVHHKHYRNVFNEKMEDLEVLCEICHKMEHGIVVPSRKK